MSWMGVRRNETFGGWHEMQRRDITAVKTNGSKTSRFLEKKGNITLAM